MRNVQIVASASGVLIAAGVVIGVVAASGSSPAPKPAGADITPAAVVTTTAPTSTAPIPSVVAASTSKPAPVRATGSVTSTAVVAPAPSPTHTRVVLVIPSQVHVSEPGQVPTLPPAPPTVPGGGGPSYSG